MKKMLLLAVMLFAARLIQAQGSLGFYTSLPQFASGQSTILNGDKSTILYLSGSELSGSFGMSDRWLISLFFPAADSEPSTSLQFLGPIDSVFPPFDGFPGGESITYQADFTLDDTQLQQLLNGQVQIRLEQDLLSIDPDFIPFTAQDYLQPVPEPGAVSMALAGLFIWVLRLKRRSLSSLQQSKRGGGRCLRTD